MTLQQLWANVDAAAPLPLLIGIFAMLGFFSGFAEFLLWLRKTSGSRKPVTYRHIEEQQERVARRFRELDKERDRRR